MWGECQRGAATVARWRKVGVEAGQAGTGGWWVETEVGVGLGVQGDEEGERG